MEANIGKTWAIVDHFEKSTGKPVSLETLKRATGYDRKQFRKWVRQGRLVEHRVRELPRTPERIAYTRPKVEGSAENVVLSKEDAQVTPVQKE